jgi:hypothetical protein
MSVRVGFAEMKRFNSLMCSFARVLNTGNKETLLLLF